MKGLLHIRTYADMNPTSYLTQHHFYYLNNLLINCSFVQQLSRSLASKTTVMIDLDANHRLDFSILADNLFEL